MLNGTNGAIPGRTQKTSSGGAVMKVTQRDARLATIYLPEILDCRGCLEAILRRRNILFHVRMISSGPKQVFAKRDDISPS
jgi:hypothetical protein